MLSHLPRQPSWGSNPGCLVPKLRLKPLVSTAVPITPGLTAHSTGDRFVPSVGQELGAGIGGGMSAAGAG